MNFTVKDLLKFEVAPALGCTEPVAIALGAAAAASLLPDKDIDRIEIWVDPNIYKNGVAVIIPGTHGLTGLDTAAALGAISGDPHLGMEVLTPLDNKGLEDARHFLEEKDVTVNLRREKGLYVRVKITSEKHTAGALITRLHNNIVGLWLDGEEVKNDLLSISSGDNHGADLHTERENWLKKLKLEDLCELVSTFDKEDMQFLKKGVEYNLKLAEHGLKYGSGLGIGKATEQLLQQELLVNDMATSARMLTAAAADARMGGVKLPAMSSAGSGNHGLTAILPIWAVKDFVDHDEQTVLEAIGLSHIVTAYVKAHTGRLSAICGCSVAAGAGATAGITYLMGGTVKQMEGAIKNIVEDLAGVICDGAKAGCALKLNTAAGAAVQAALFALQGVNVKDTDGIIGDSTQSTVQNMGTLSTDGMVETDKAILDIMLKKQLSRKKKRS